jgi:predicted outer membrane lipoprotein
MGPEHEAGHPCPCNTEVRNVTIRLRGVALNFIKHMDNIAFIFSIILTGLWVEHVDKQKKLIELRYDTVKFGR